MMMLGGIPLRTPQELAIMREAGRLVAAVLADLEPAVVPGVTTRQLDALAEDAIRRRGGRPAFKGYESLGKPPFPASICASVNDEVVHGIPDGRALKDGDIISVDVGVEYQGFYGDTARTYPVGHISAAARKLMDVCSQALDLAIQQVRPGNALSKIGETVQRHVEAHGFSVVRDFVGHGIGTVMHQAPEVPNFASNRYPGLLLEPGLVIAIEPMINAGGHKIAVDRNRWTVRTADGKLSAHFEHTVAVTPDGHEILTLP